MGMDVSTYEVISPFVETFLLIHKLFQPVQGQAWI